MNTAPLNSKRKAAEPDKYKAKNNDKDNFMKYVFFLFLSLVFLGCPDDEPCTTCPTPLDSTSHAFTWQTFTWGGGGSSSINDIAIINDTNIWAVGAIQLLEYDSLDQRDYRPYCIAHWNGSNWELRRLRYFPPGSAGDSLSVMANAIYARNDHDIWLAAQYMFHYNGVNWTPVYNTGAEGATRIWGDNSGKLWCVGRNGTIVHFNGVSWQKLESGTTNYISDIYGAQNSKTGEWEVLAVAEQSDTLPFQTQLLRIQGTFVSTIEVFSQIYFSVWFVPGESYYLAGDGILWKNKLSDVTWNTYPLGTITQYGIGCIRGTRANDVFSTGSYFEVAHYNGSTWRNYSNEIASGLGTFGRVVLKGNTMVAGGYFDQNAILLIGKR